MGSFRVPGSGSSAVLSGRVAPSSTSKFTPPANPNPGSSIFPLAFSTVSAPAGKVAVAYNLPLLVQGGTQAPVSFSLASGSLPAGLALNSSTGVISGTPSAAGTSNPVVRATDGNTKTDLPLTIVIAT